jgi:S-formylglutathione hydrolase FrmB
MEMIQAHEIPPMIIAMPSDGLWGDGSGYLKHSSYNFEKWIAEDVVAALTEKVIGASHQSPLFIGGLSMGGFGALRIGAKYPGKFKGIAGHSSITSLDQMKLFVEEDLLNYSQKDQADEDLFNTFQKYRDSLPPIRFDCGTSDLLIEYNRELHRKMVEEKLDHEYDEYPGGHEWSYWEKYVPKSLHFFAEQLK